MKYLVNYLGVWALCFALALPAWGLWVLIHHGSKPPAPVAGLVQFELGTHSSYGTPSFTVTADNGNAAPVTVHRITVRFMDDQGYAHVITDVTEQVGVTVPGGQAKELTYSAPAAVVNTAVADKFIGVTVTGWS